MTPVITIPLDLSLFKQVDVHQFKNVVARRVGLLYGARIVWVPGSPTAEITGAIPSEQIYPLLDQAYQELQYK